MLYLRLTHEQHGGLLVQVPAVVPVWAMNVCMPRSSGFERPFEYCPAQDSVSKSAPRHSWASESAARRERREPSSLRQLFSASTRISTGPCHYALDDRVKSDATRPTPVDDGAGAYVAFFAVGHSSRSISGQSRASCSMSGLYVSNANRSKSSGRLIGSPRPGWMGRCRSSGTK